MNSHEFAKQLRQTADFLESRPEFPIGDSPRIPIFYWACKDTFLSAVRAVGSLKKNYDSTGGIEVKPDGAPMLVLCADRSSVCRKVQEEKWECEPLLSQEEEAQIGVAS